MLILKQAFIVFRKEILDAFRDKRSLRMAFLPPLYFIAMFVGGVLFAVHLANSQKESGITSVEIPVEGAERLPEFVAYLKEQGAKIKPVERDAFGQVKAKTLDLAIVISAKAEEKRAQGETVNVSLVYDAANVKNNQAVSFARNIFYSWNGQQRARQLLGRGISPSVGEPAWLNEINVADERKMSVIILGSLPMTLLLAAFIGSIGFSADMTAGERERRTLESLLITPVNRTSLYIGKWLTSLTLTLGVLLFQLIALSVALYFLPFNQLGLRVEVGVFDMVKIFSMLIPVAFFAVGLQLTIAIFAKSFKDAQTLVGLLVFLPMIPLMYTIFNPGVFYEWWLWVPVLGETAMIKNVFLGDAVPASALIKFWIVAFVFTAIVLPLGVKQFGRPKIIYG